MAITLLLAACNYDPDKYAQSIIKKNALVRKTGSEVNIRTVARVLEDYYAENGTYPVGSSYAVLSSTLSPDFIHVLPPHDAWGFTYRYQSDGKTFRLSSVGPDGLAGTADDIVVTGAH